MSQFQPSGNCLAITEPGRNGKFDMLRGRLTSTVRPVSASTLATVIESGRRPLRPAPASPPSIRTLKRPSWAPVTSPLPNIVTMKSRWTPTRCAPKSSTAAAVRLRNPLSPTTASRWFCWSDSGWPSRQASMKSSTQPIAAAISSDAQHAEDEGVGHQVEDRPVPDQAHQQGADQREQRRRTTRATRCGRPFGCPRAAAPTPARAGSSPSARRRAGTGLGWPAP